MALDNFHLGDHQKYRSGGIRLLMSNTSEDLRLQQEKVISILNKYSRITIINDVQFPQVDLSNVRASNLNRVMNLLELNSSLIDALHYSKDEIIKNCNNLSDLTNEILKLKMTVTDNNKVDIYNFIDVNIGEIIHNIIYDISRGHYEPSKKELGELKELEQTRASFLKFLNQTKIITLGRSKEHF